MTRIRNIISYLIVLSLPTQLGKHFWPPFSYISGIQVDYLSPTIYATDVLIGLLFINLLLSKSKILHLTSLILNPKIFLLLLFLILGIVLSKSPLAGFYGLLKLIEFAFLGYYIARTKLNPQVIIAIFSLGILFESLLAIAQFMSHGSIGGILYYFGERTFTGETPGIANAVLKGELVLRPYGTLPHPNVLAGYLTIAMTIVSLKFKVPHFAKASRGKQSSKLEKITYVTSILLGTIALLLTMSRVAIVLWLLVVCYWFVKKSFIGLLVVLVCIGSIFFFSSLSSRFTHIKLTDESIIVRTQLSAASFEMIKKHPLFGVGLNNFLINLSDVQKALRQAQGKANVSVYSFQPVHNIYLLVLAETGIVGLSAFVLLLFITYRKVKSSKLKVQSYILLSIVLVVGLFDHYFLTLQQGQLLLACVLGFLWSTKMVQ